jgi:hypothetical protein
MVAESDKTEKKEYSIDSMKVSRVINVSSRMRFNINFSNDGNTCIHI